MKTILKLTLFLFLMIFSLNVYSQSEKLKELQQTLEDWENFPFELYVLKRDKDKVYDRLVGSSGRLVGIYPDKGNSIDKPRVYNYTIQRYMPLIENYVSERKSMTIDSKYSKSEYEDHKKSGIDKVFKQIDEQIELEKNQEENRKATAQKNAERKRKRGDYLKKQKELIENKKDSILELFYINSVDVLESIRNINEGIPIFNSSTKDIYSFATVSPYGTRILDRDEKDNFLMNKLLMFTNREDNILNLFGDCYWPDRKYRYRDWYEDYGFVEDEYVNYRLDEDEKTLVSLFLNTEFNIRVNQFIRLKGMAKSMKRLEKRVLYFFNEFNNEDFNSEGSNDCRSYYLMSLQKRLYWWYKDELRNSEKLGYDYKYTEPDQAVLSIFHHEIDLYKSMIDEYLMVYKSTDYLKTNLRILKKTKISLSVIGNLSDWLNFYHSKVTDDYTSRTTLRRGKFKKINKIVESSLEPGELKIYKILMTLHLQDYEDIVNYNGNFTWAQIEKYNEILTRNMSRLLKNGPINPFEKLYLIFNYDPLLGY